MKKFLKKLAVIAVAVVMVASLSLGLFAGCRKKYNLSVYIFAGEADQVTNGQLIREWETKYANYLKQKDPEKFGENFKITVDDEYEVKTEKYFDNLETQIASGSAADIFYVSPKYVKSYAATGSVLDLTTYVNWDNYNPNGLWSQAIGAYAYDTVNNTIGDPVTYDESSKTFKTEAGKTAGLYALPKDFSSFGLAYNRNFFSDALKTKYTTTVDTRGAVQDTNGNATNIINIGKTTRYFPFNFYKYDTYQAALTAGDPIANASNGVGGYEVTILGWPGQTYDTGKEDVAATYYDESVGYYVYTYAEYSAMTWAVCYYAERYDITNRDTRAHKDMTWLNDANRPSDAKLGDNNKVYGNDQYESTLYLTAWLLGNDVDIISEDYKSVTAPSADADYGINSDAFKEAYAAFLAYGSDWNNNSYFSGSGEGDSTRGGWPTFNAGRCVFYGIGTWNLATFNSAEQSILDIGIMPEPVSEDHAVYSKVKNAKYEPQVYSNSVSKPVTEAMSLEQCNAKQVDRQEKWKARLDTVGYGVNADVLKRYKGENEWKVAAMADLCAYLAMDETMQQALTYSGSQLTTFIDQGEDYLYYQAADRTDGSFKYMITPDGNATGTLTVTADEVNALKADKYLPDSFTADTTLEGGEIWQFATAVATKMFRDHTKESGTVENYVTSKFPSLKDYLNTYFKSSLIKICDSKAYAYKCLNLVALRYNDRNLQIRMASGANGALDSCMYTYDSQWINDFGNTKSWFLIAYEETRAIGGYKRVIKDKAITLEGTGSPVKPGSAPTKDGGGTWSGNFYTPDAYCNWQVKRSQNLLNEAIKAEQNMLK